MDPMERIAKALEGKLTPEARQAFLEALKGGRGTIRKEYRRCGKPRCSCTTGTGHGPYLYACWRDGKTVKKRYVGKA